MEEKEKVKLSRRAVKNIMAVMSLTFAVAMASMLLVLGVRYEVIHDRYGFFMISPFEQAEDFQNTQAFYQVFERELADISLYMAISSQLESDGKFDPDKTVDVFEYMNRRRDDSLNIKKYPKLTYRVGDLIEWANYGVSRQEMYLPYEEAIKYMSKEEMKTQLTEQGFMPEYLELEDYGYNVISIIEEFKPQNVSSVRELEFSEGIGMQDVLMAIEETMGDLATNYASYVECKERFRADKNLKYMFVDANGIISYTNLENKEKLSVEELAKAFTDSKTFAMYDYKNNILRSRNLKAADEPMYKQTLRQYNYCFPLGGTLYVAIQTKSSSAFGAYNSDDFYAVADANLKMMDVSWEKILVLAGVFAVLMLVTLVAFIVLQPKKKKEELKYFDRWYTEIAAAVAVGSACVMIACGACVAVQYLSHDMYKNPRIDLYSNGFASSICITFVVLYAMFLFYMGSLVRRMKAKALWKGSLCYYLFRNIKKICGKFMVLIRKVMEELLNHKTFFVRALGPYLLFWFINVALLVAVGSIGILFAVLFDGVIAVYIYYENKAREKIVEGIKRICNGDVEYQIDTTYFFGENKVIAEAVNSIGEAVNTAVQISMKDERLKADLITNVSHDIKTPLTSIINYVDLLKRENIQGEKAQEYIRVLDEKSQRLKQLTLDLVEASKISSGNITLEMNDIDVAELLKQAVGEYEEKLSEKNLVLIESYPEEKMTIRADSRRMWRVTENLLVNICKYSMEGTRVYVDVAKVTEETVTDIGTDSSAHMEMVEITFKNISAQPLNIPAEELTERFIRGDVSRSTEGSGLGLSIAQNLTVAQGGQFKIYLDGDLFKVVLRFPRK